MTIHPEGYRIIIGSVFLACLFNALVHYACPKAKAVKYSGYLLSLVFLMIIVQFFRRPNISVAMSEQHVLCPADGKIVVMQQTQESEFFQDKRIQISIFMSPLNVHVNRNPISGTVKYLRYHPGKYLFAWLPKSSADNEHTSIVVENAAGVQILFRQIAGALARRIVYYVKEGDKVAQGQEFGFIKFGSRVDVFLPLNAHIKVRLNDVVEGGKTVLAKLN